MGSNTLKENFNKVPITGNVTYILHKNGEFDPKEQKMTKDAVVVEQREFKNLIVNVASNLMAGRMCPSGYQLSGSSVTTLSSGFQYLAVGTGVGTGSTQAPQAESNSAARLREELTRKAFTAVNYLAGSNPSASITNKLQLSTTFTEAEANGPIVEMGLFGGNASSAANTGYLFNYKVFPVLNKDNTVRLTIIWEITF